MLGDISSKPLIIAKGIMFLALAVLAAILLFLEAPSLRGAGLIMVLVWASCRFYYFLFYVLEHYVDAGFRYSGLGALLRQILRIRVVPPGH